MHMHYSILQTIHNKIHYKQYVSNNNNDDSDNNNNNNNLHNIETKYITLYSLCGDFSTEVWADG